MRRRAWVAIGSAALAIAVGLLADATGTEGLHVLAGSLVLLAVLIGISLLPFWPRILPPVDPMPGLFNRPVEGERWCTLCGTPAPADDTCGVCGAPAPEPRPNKQRKGAQS